MRIANEMLLRFINGFWAIVTPGQGQPLTSPCFGLFPKTGSSSLSFRNFHQLLASVLALQHADECPRCIFDPLDDVLADFNFAGVEPFRQLRESFGIAVGELKHQKPFHPRPLLDELPKKPWPHFRFGKIVL